MTGKTQTDDPRPPIGAQPVEPAIQPTDSGTVYRYATELLAYMDRARRPVNTPPRESPETRQLRLARCRADWIARYVRPGTLAMQRAVFRTYQRMGGTA